MTAEEMQAFLSKANNAIIGVNRTDNGPQLTPVWYVWDGTKFWFSTTTKRSKYTNIKRDPFISVIIDDLETHQYVAAYGKAEIIEDDIADVTRVIIKKYLPAERAEQMLQGVLNDPTRVLITLQPDKIVTH